MNMTSPARTAETSATASPDRRSMRCETSTPFGRPVVPEVYMTAKVSSAAGAGSFHDGASPRDRQRLHRLGGEDLHAGEIRAARRDRGRERRLRR